MHRVPDLPSSPAGLAGPSPIRRVRDVPAVAAGSIPGYGPVFNPGLVQHAGRLHLFARVVREGYRHNDGAGPRFLDYVSDIAVFESVDGDEWVFSYVLARAGDEGVDCFEDPRVQVVAHGDGHAFVMTYTNLPADPASPWRVGAHRLVHDGDRFRLQPGSGRVLGPDGLQDKDAVVFELADGRVAMIHRLHPNMQLAVFEDLDHLWDADQDYWDLHLAQIDHHTIIRPNRGALGIGAGAPPIAVDEGLLLFFHERRVDGAYTMNLALLDREHGRPLVILPDALLEPELEWEVRGDVDQVVFVQGANLCDDGDTILLAYGAADRHVGIAHASARHLIDLLGTHQGPPSALVASDKA